MPLSSTRRLFLATVGLPLVGAPVPGREPGRERRGGSRADGSRPNASRPAGSRTLDPPDGPFDPAVHGFGFRNWSTTTPAFPEHDHEAVAEERVRTTIEERWRGSADRALGTELAGISRSLLDVIARQVYVSVNQRSATNGHCYGMVFAAQRYYERPDAIPLDRATASEVRHPAEPLDSPVERVGADVDHFQNRQFLDVHAWVGRRMLLRPSWIEYGAQLDRLRAAVDEYGTAGITLMNARTRTLHQALVHGYRRTSTGVSIALYDPNWSAAEYRQRDGAGWLRLDVDLSGERAVVGPYGSAGYDAFVFNPLDRSVAERTALLADVGNDADPDATDGPGAADGPYDVGPADRLFPVALFLVDAAAVRLAVVGPDGRPVGRDVSPFMDRRGGEYHAMRYRYGAAPGRYRIALTGADDAEYTLEARAADADGDLLDAAASASIAAGETHRYVATVPGTADGDGSLERVDGRGRLLGLTGAGVGVAGLAAGGYAAVRARRRRGRAQAGGDDGSGE